MTIIFNVNADGSVQTAPALVPQGVGVDVVVITPFAGICSMFVTPPDQMMYEPVLLAPVLERGNDIIYKGRLPKTTAQTAGKAVYQIRFTDSDGGEIGISNKYFGLIERGDTVINVYDDEYSDDEPAALMVTEFDPSEGAQIVGVIFNDDYFAAKINERK